MISELFSPFKFPNLTKNKYGGFVIQKAVVFMSQNEKQDTKKLINSKLDITSNKERIRLESFLKLLD
jgi:hypothetical protein